MNLKNGMVVLGATHVCQAGVLCVLCMDSSSCPQHPRWWGEPLTWTAGFVFTFHWEATQKCEWSRAFLLQFWAQKSSSVKAADSSAQFFVLICSAWVVRSPSIPSLIPLLQSKSSLFPHCTLAKSPVFSQAFLNGFSSLLPAYFPSWSLPIALPVLLFPNCLSQTLGPGSALRLSLAGHSLNTHV